MIPLERGGLNPINFGQAILAVLFTSVVSQIAAEDLTFAGDYLNSRTFRSFEIYFTITLIYLGIVWFIKAISFLIEPQYRITSVGKLFSFSSSLVCKVSSSSSCPSLPISSV
jgi:polar amino acid transport system permease protein